MRIRELAVRVALAAACVLWASGAVAGAAKKVVVTQWLPFELAGGHVVVPVTVNGAAARAMLDTGASLHMLDRSFAEAHGIAFGFGGAIVVQAGHSRERLPVARGLPIELFGAPVELRVVPVGDVPFADLVIGTPVLSSFIMQIDYANERIRFTSHDAINLAESKNVEMRKSGYGGWPAVRATIDGEDAWLILDTGFTGPLLLKPEFVRERGWQAREGSLSVDALGNVRGVARYAIPLVQLGPYDIRGVVASTPDEGRLPAALTLRAEGRVPMSGMLGAELLRHFLLTLDVKNVRAHLAPAEKLAAESWESSTSPGEGEEHAEPESPAAEPAPAQE